MKSNQALVLLVFGLLAPGSLWAAITVTLSTDHKTVTVDYGNGTKRVFYRQSFPAETFTVSGRTYYVDPNGSDTTGNGSSGNPYQTISYAYSLANPDDLIYINAGNYYEHLNLTRSGTAGHPIIISAAPGAIGQVLVTVSASYISSHPTTDIIYCNNIQYVTINGLTIQGIKSQPGAASEEHNAANAVSTGANGSQNLTLTNNIIYSGLHCGVKGGVNNVLDGNVIFNNGTNSLDHGVYVSAAAGGWTITRNVSFDNTGYGVQSYSTPANMVITKNILAWNGEGGIVQGGANGIIQYNIVVNNQRGIFYFRGGCTGNTVTNNIFAYNTSKSGDADNCGGGCGGPTGNTDDYNVYYPQAPNALIAPGPNTVYSDPRLINGPAGDLRLSFGSPATGGLANYLVPTVNASTSVASGSTKITGRVSVQ